MDKGAHFYKCDFQVHTPRDLNWDGPEVVTDTDRKSFAQKLVAACRSKGIRSVAITDHHDFAFFQYIREAANTEQDAAGVLIPIENRLIVYPGVELTLGIPCQAILILDADFPINDLPSVLTALAITPSPDNQAKIAQIAKLEHIKDFALLYSRLNEQPNIRGRFIVFPHVQDGGTQTLLRSGFNAHYKSMPCVGGYTDGLVSKMNDGCRKIVTGQDANYGNKKIAVIQTSDSRSITFSALGTAPSWIKWATPTAEALRQACLSDRSRIALAEPTYPKARILSISVTDSVFLGNVSLNLNPQYNTFIGGRGTGKSSLLEYLRWGLCDQPVEVREEQIGDIPNYAAKRELLISGTLQARDAIVTVACELNGVNHTIRRETKTGKVEISVGNSPWAITTEQEIRDKFPIQAYSQKQLSSVGVLPTEIERLVTAEIAAQVDSINTSIKLLSDSIRHLWAQSRRKSTLKAEIAREESQIASEKAQVEALRTQLAGLSPEDQTVLAQASVYTRQHEVLESILKLHKSLKDSLSTHKHELSQITAQFPATDGLPDKELLEKIIAPIKTEILRISGLCDEALKNLAEGADLQKFIADSANSIAAKHTDFKNKYEAAKSRSTSHQSALTELTRLEQSLNTLTKASLEKTTLFKELGDPNGELVLKWKEWAERHRERSELIRAQCERLHTLSNGDFRAHAKACGNPKPVKEALVKCFANKNIRRAEEKIESITEAIISNSDPLKAWIELADELDNLAASPDAQNLPDTPILERALLSRQNRQNLREGLTPESILDLRLTILEDNPQFEFKAGPGKYITFVEASSGQQATSLLKVLLNQDGPPLLIDQPEEDLDNEVIQEIASTIWDTKSKRQLIFASHNANIVVNGDAELVVCFDYLNPLDMTKGHIKCQGAIDIPEVKNAIKRVMEGGDTAFELRRVKYGF